MICPKCGADVPEGFKFCGQCGAHLLSKTERLTNFVKKQVAEIKPAHKEWEKAERRVVTVLFGDVSGFTEMSEDMDPEEVRAKMNRLFEELTEAITEFGGTVDKYIGDCIMSLFGAPKSHEDDPERAIKAGLKMQEILGKTEFNMRIGINKGLCIAGKFGSQLKEDYTVIGDTVNLASRLETVARIGSVLVSKSTYQDTRYMFNFKKPPPLKVKGKKEPIQVYEVLNVRKQPLQKRGIQGLSSRMIGRTHELHILQTCFKEVINGNGRIVTISGNAGIGKSRLVREFKNSITPKLHNSSTQTTIWLESTGLEYAKTVGYRMIVEMLSQYMGNKKLEDCLKSLGIQEILPYLNYLFVQSGVTSRLSSGMCQEVTPDTTNQSIKYLKPRELKEAVFQSITKFFSKLADSRPLILLFEDLHWADSVSIEVIKEIAKSLSNKRILIILAFRPDAEKEYLQTFGPLKKNTPDIFKEIPIKALDDKKIRELMHSFLPIPEKEISSQIELQIMDKAKGNPFYIEEIIKSLIQSKMLLQIKGGWVPAGEITKLDVPEGLQALIMSRIDTISTQERQVLRISSVIGNNFSTTLLAEITKGYISKESLQLSDTLAKLEKSGLLQRAHNENYSFAHSLFQEVAYQSLLKETRAKLHEHIGETIERTHKDNLIAYYEVIAHHYYKSKNQNKALTYLVLSGKKSERIYAGKEALDYYTQALSILEKLPGKGIEDKTELLSDRGNVRKQFFGDYKGALVDYEKAMKLSQDIKDRGREAKSLSNIGSVFRETGEYEKALLYYGKGMKIAENLNDTNFSARLLSKIGVVYDDIGKFENALTYYKNSLERSKELRDKVIALNNIGVIYDNKGNHEKALKYYNECLGIDRELDDKRGIAASFTNIGIVHKKQKKYEKALSYLKKSLKVAEEISYKQGMAICLTNIGGIYYKREKYNDALKYQKRALELKQELGAKWGTANSLDEIGQIYQKLEELKQAIRYHQWSLQIAKEIGAKVIEASALINLGIAKSRLLSADRHGKRKVEAQKLIETGLAIAEKVGEKEVIEHGKNAIKEWRDKFI